MNPKVILGFVAGVAVASGVSYFAIHRSAVAPSTPVAPQVASVEAAAPAAIPAPEPNPQARVDAQASNDKTGAIQPPKVKKAAAVPAKATEAKPIEMASAKAPAATPISTQPQVSAAPEPAPIVAAPAPPASQPAPEKRAAPVESRVLRPESFGAAKVSAPARIPNTVTIPQGTILSVRLGEGLSSDRNLSGDEFTGTLNEPLVVNELVIAEKGSKIEGRVLESTKAGRVKGLSRLSIELTRLHTSDGQNLSIHTSTFAKDGPESKKEDAAKVGAGAALGAIIGAIAGGGKGAAIGAAAGGAAGGGTVAATRGKPAVLPVETPVQLRLQEPVTVTERLN